MPDVMDDVRAAYGAVLAAKAALEHVMDANAVPTGAPAHEQPSGCPHNNRQAAGAFGGIGPRDFCADCQCFIYPDGRVERADS